MVDDKKGEQTAKAVGSGQRRKKGRRARPSSEGSDKARERMKAHNAALEETRQSLMASLTFAPCDLPIVAHFDEIAAHLQNRSVVVVAGETGSGKSTQLPQFLLRCGYGRRGLIGHTQPRRLAATALASTLNEQVHSPVGEICGYQIRFQSTLTDNHLIKVMTDGVLLTEIGQDRLLDRYEVLIIDEAHERSTNIDLLLGYLKYVLRRRPELKVIITSATLDSARFQAFFNQAPLLEVSGRQYPVEMRFRDVSTLLGERPDSPEAVLWAVESVLPELSQGVLRGRDGLVFLPTERHIQAASRHLRQHLPSGVRVMPLYARLPQKEQREIFNVGGKTRIILSTNVAETSLTVPNIGFVIDSGTARVSRYSVHSKVQRLPIEAISRASANQRAGRCGRIGPGVCIRLYSETDFQARAAHTEPEIMRSHLAGVLLQLMALRLGDVSAFDFLDPPDPRLLRDGLQCLEHIGAITRQRSGPEPVRKAPDTQTDKAPGIKTEKKGYQLTSLGWRIAHLPLDPQLGRILLAGESLNCLREQLILVSFLGVQDPRERSFWEDVTARQCLKTFLDTESDFMAILRLWAWFEENRTSHTRRSFQKLCQQFGLSVMRLYEWLGLHRQLLLWVRRNNMRINAEPASYECMHRALLSGWPFEIANLHPEGYYQGVRGRKLFISPGSRLKNKKFPWLLVGEIIETEKQYAHRVARIDPVWVEAAARPWIRSQLSEPFWDTKRAEVRVRERGLLLGLTLYDNRARSLVAIDPVAAREHFIRFALVQGLWRSGLDFEAHNGRVHQALAQWEHKLRRLDIRAEADTLYDFFDTHVPASVTDRTRFIRWATAVRAGGGHEQDALKLDLDTLIAPLGFNLKTSFWPDTWLPRARPQKNAVPFRLTYLFDMSNAADGVTLHVSEARMNEITGPQLTWFIPGYRAELLAATVRAFPKSVRRRLPPLPNWRDEALAWLAMRDAGTTTQPPDRQESFIAALCLFWRQHCGVDIDGASFDARQLPDWLRFRMQVEGVDGAVLAEGRDWEALCQRTVAQARQLPVSRSGRQGKTLPQQIDSLYRDWTFGDLPEQLLAEVSSATVKASSFDGKKTLANASVSGYCALIDRGEGVEIGAFSQQGAALESHRQGIIRLYLLRARLIVRSLKKETDLMQQSLDLGDSPQSLFNQALFKTAQNCFLAHLKALYSQREFEACWEARRQFFISQYQAVLATLKALAEQVRAVRQRLLGMTSPAVQPTRLAIDAQLRRLLREQFIVTTPLEWLARFPVYCQGMLSRMDRLQGNLQRDAEYEQRVMALEGALDKALDARAFPPDTLLEVRWLLEELRLSLFAQHLKTRGKVSEKRIKKQIDDVA